MAFSLPELPYPYDALEPHMSKETLEYHHDKHHMAYVTNGNNLLKDSGLDDLSLSKIVKASYGKNQGLFNNAGQHYNHIHFWKWMKPKGGGKNLPARLQKAIDSDLGGFDKARNDFIQAGDHAVRLGLVLDRGEGRQARDHEDTERREPAGARRASRSSAAMCGSIPITSTTAIAGRNISRPGRQPRELGPMSRKCSSRRPSRRLRESCLP